MCVLLTEENQGKIGFAATADLGENSAMSSTWMASLKKSHHHHLQPERHSFPNFV